MTSVISFHTLHDANISICVDGKLLAVLELERLFNVRYFCSAPKKSKFTDQWKRAIKVICKFTGVTSFDIAITSWVMPSQREVLQTLVQADKWVTVDHHVAHAALGFYDSPFSKALVLSYDGGGNDGTFNVYVGSRKDGLQHLKWFGLNLGTPYRQLATTMPEVTRGQRDPQEIGTYMRFAPLALSGKVMGYAALGRVRPDWVPSMREYYERFVTPLTSLFTLGERLGVCLEADALSNTEARDVAATSQWSEYSILPLKIMLDADRAHVFSQLLCERIHELLPVIEERRCEGMVLTGGCALVGHTITQLIYGIPNQNVHANQFVVESFGLPVHVPPAPNDCGISVGAAWAVSPPRGYQPVQYSGLPCWDQSALPQLVKDRKPQQVTPEMVAKLLLAGAVIGVVRGRQEFGPRALGHRSMLCYPDRESLKEKLNKLKSREWFRPLCPSVAIESVPKLFEGKANSTSRIQGEDLGMLAERFQVCLQCGETAADWLPASPYMSFAPHMTSDTRQMFPAICHFDGTARLQTVRRQDDEWYHTLLTEVATLNGGYGILLNTSLNVKGKPILNQLATALDILDNSPEESVDFILLEDWLFTPHRKASEL